MKRSDPTPRPQAWALSPLLVFMLLYLGTSLWMGDFYKMPITVAFLASSAYALLTTRGLPMEERVALFSRGASEPNLLTMVWIFLLAGAFAQSAKAMGAVDAAVGLTLHLLPAHFLLPGIFLAACFISLSVGTSVGTIVALAPIVAGLSQQTSASLPLMTAIVVGGSFFGDNLSFISDTTIAATRTQGCLMRDKFRTNFLIVLPAALTVLLLYTFIGWEVPHPTHLPPVRWLPILPYLLVLLTALMGWSVLLVLSLGILSCGLIGVCSGAFAPFAWAAAMGSGMAGMSDLIIVTLLAGGMLELIRYNGGMQYLMHHLSLHVHGKRGAELSIGLLVSIANLCTANNTIAILTTGPLARDIAGKYGISPHRSASLLDTFSCITQGLIPYGAQILMASTLAGVSPLQILLYLYYPVALGLCTLSAIYFRRPRRYA